jgi:hypothetical protein
MILICMLDPADLLAPLDELDLKAKLGAAAKEVFQTRSGFDEQIARWGAGCDVALELAMFPNRHEQSLHYRSSHLTPNGASPSV